MSVNEPSDLELPPLLEPRARRRSPLARALLLLGAAVCMVLGVIGWLVPVVTGIPFYIAGFAMLGAASPRAARWINRAEAALPVRWRLGLRAALERATRRGQSSPRARSSAIVADSTASNGSGSHPSSARALDASKRK